MHTITYFHGTFNYCQMDAPKYEYKKILFRFYSNLLEESTVETLWALTIDPVKGYYKLDNIPFYVPGLASDDIILAEYDEDEQMMTYRELVECSGNSAIQVIVRDTGKDASSLRADFKKAGCPSEGLNERYFVVGIPVGLDYRPIRQRLVQLQEAGIIDYAEACLADGHRY